MAIAPIEPSDADEDDEVMGEMMVVICIPCSASICGCCGSGCYILTMATTSMLIYVLAEGGYCHC